jgi:hypothetical protein
MAHPGAREVKIVALGQRCSLGSSGTIHVRESVIKDLQGRGKI